MISSFSQSSSSQQTAFQMCIMCTFCVFLKKIDILHAGVLLTSEMFSIQSNIYIFIGIMALVEEMAQLVEGLP